MRFPFLTKKSANVSSDAGLGATREIMRDLTPHDFSVMAVNALDSEYQRLLGWRGAGRGAGSQYNSFREIDEVCGYTSVLTWDDYWSTYDRFELAARLVEAYPEATFTQNPQILDSDDARQSKFEAEIEHLMVNKGGYAALYRLDILAGIGEYGILFIGLDDGAELNTPVNKGRHNSILYFRPIKQGDVRIKEWDADIHSARYGMPRMYEITLHRPPLLPNAEDAAVVTTNVDVHYTRVIHYADNKLDDPIRGIPRLHRVFNRLADMLKLVAGSAEMFWRGAYQGMAFEMEADAQVEPDMKTAMKKDVENYLRGLSRHILLQGTKAHSLAPNIASPKDHFEVGITMLAIAGRIPKRILMGSEEGKLASTQDLRAWNRAVEVRRSQVTEPDLLREFIDWGLEYNVFRRRPRDGKYKVKWAPLYIPDESERVKIAAQYTNALSTYTTSQLYHVMPFDVYLQEVWKMDAILAGRMAALADFSKVVVKTAAPSDRDTKQEYETRVGNTPKEGDDQ